LTIRNHVAVTLTTLLGSLITAELSVAITIYITFGNQHLQQYSNASVEDLYSAHVPGFAKGGAVPDASPRETDPPPQTHWPGIPLDRAPDRWLQRRQQDKDEFNPPQTFWGPWAAKGGAIPGRGGGDTVPAMLTPGEFVVPPDVAKWVGEQNCSACPRPAKRECHSARRRRWESIALWFAMMSVF
jgi:hypothetical protein